MDVAKSADRIRRALSGIEAAWQVEVVESTGSTNADLLAGVRRGTIRPYTALIARQQLAGRGRLDRVWETVPGQSLALSAALPLPGPSERWGLVPLMAGLAVVDAVSELGVTARLKWPNDVLVDGRKLAGILVEASGSVVVVGIGLNVGQTDRTMGSPDRISLKMAGIEVTLEQVAMAILSYLPQAVAEPDLVAYRTHCDTIGQRVRLSRSALDPVEGLALAVAGTGELVVDLGSGAAEHFAAGDVVHVRWP